jgi:hypothetical protein
LGEGNLHERYCDRKHDKVSFQLHHPRFVRLSFDNRGLVSWNA